MRRTVSPETLKKTNTLNHLVSLLVPAAGGSSHQHGRRAVGHVEDLKALQQQLLEGSALLLNMEAALWTLKASQAPPQVRPSCSR